MKQEQLIERLEQQKMKLFATHTSTEEAMKMALDILAECSPGQVTTAIMQYHNTLIQEIQNLIKTVKD